MSRSAQQSFSLESDARLSLEAAARMIQEHEAADKRFATSSRRAVIPTPSHDMGSDEESSSREDRRHRRRRARRRREREEEEEAEEEEEEEENLNSTITTNTTTATTSNLMDATRVAALNQVLSAAANIADPVALSLSALRALTVRLNTAESSVELATSRAIASESEAASIRATAALVTASLTERLGELESDMATLRARSAGANASAEHRIAEMEAENAALAAQLLSASSTSTHQLLHTREEPNNNHATDEELVLLSDEIGRLQREEMRLNTATLEATTYSTSLRDDNNELRAALTVAENEIIRVRRETALAPPPPPPQQQQQPSTSPDLAILLASRDHELARALDSVHALNARLEIAERESKRARADAEASDMEAIVAKNRASTAEVALERSSRLLDVATISLADVRERAIATASSDAAALSASRATEQWLRDALNTADAAILALKNEKSSSSVPIRQQPPPPPLPYRQLSSDNNDDARSGGGGSGTIAAGRSIVQRSSSLDLFAVPEGGGGGGGGGGGAASPIRALVIGLQNLIQMLGALHVQCQCHHYHVHHLRHFLCQQ
jgi:hypothetical protein